MTMILPRFSIEQPSTLAEASEMLVSYGDSARAYAGGTELLLAMKKGGLRYERLVDLKTVSGLNTIEERDGAVHIGSLATHMAVEHSPMVASRVPVLAFMERRVANPRVRASGTLGGNLCFGEPHSDPATLLLALDARLHTAGPSGERDLSLSEFLLGSFDVALEEGELLRSIEVPFLTPTQRAAYEKFQINEYPMLGLAVVVDLDQAGAIREARVSVGSVSPMPRRIAAAEALLTGEVGAVRERLDQAADILGDEAELIDDREGSADYKRQLLHVFLRRAFDGALAGTSPNGKAH